MRDKIDSVISFLRPFEEILESHLVNFLTDSLYDTLPSVLRDEIDLLGVDEVMTLFWLHGSGKVFNNPSSEIKSLLDSIAEISLENGGFLVKLDKFRMTLYKRGCKKIEGLYFTEFMTPKKSHEVALMSVLISELSQFTGCSHIIDIGDGKGYLSSILALEYKLNVLGVDSSDIKTKGAAKRSQILQRAWKGYRKKISNNQQPQRTENASYKQVTKFVEPSTNLNEMVQNAFPDDALTRLGICGLHTCGDLTPASLRQFTANKSCAFIVNVSCCHHLLTESHQNQGPANVGFPMSNYLKEKNFKLGRNMLMLSLKAKQRIGSKKSTPNVSLLYRAVLQQFLVDKLGDKNAQNVLVGRIASKCNSFLQYVRTVMAKLNNSFECTDDEILDYFKKYEHMRDKIWIYSTLMSCFASIVESIILLDRLIHLEEQGFEDVHLVEMFDPVISPRCYAIVALRNTTST